MAKPALVVSFAYGDFSWIDISSYVRSVSITRGASRELENYSAGTVRIVLSNKTRYFDPTYASSPYYGKVKPGGYIRVQSGSTPSTVFIGTIDAWEFEFIESNHDMTATVSAYDGLSNIAKTALPYTANSVQYTGERMVTVLNKAEVGYAGSINADSGFNQVQADSVNEGTNALSYLQYIAKCEPGDFFVDRSGVATFRDRRWLDSSWVAGATRYNYCVEPGFEITPVKWSTGTRATSQKYINTYSWLPNYTAFNDWRSTTYTETDATKYVKNTNYYASAYIYASNSPQPIEITLALRNGATTITSSTATPTIATAGVWTRVSVGPVTTASDIDGVVLSINNSAGNLSIYIDAVMIEPASTLGVYFDGTNGITSTATTKYSTAWAGASNNSTSTLTTSTLVTNPIASYISVSDASGTDIPVMDLKVSYTSERLFNRISLTRIDGTSSGSTTVKEDPTAQSVYGIRTFADQDYLNVDDTVIGNMANELLTIYRNPELRVQSVQIATDALSGANQTTVIEADIRNVVRLTYQPMRTGATVVQYYYIIGVTHDIASNRHITTWSLGSLSNQAFKLDSNIVGVLDRNILGFG